MPICPSCTTPLVTIRQREGIYFQCNSCGGRAVTVPQVRRFAGDRFATGLLRKINTTHNYGARLCPFCNNKMLQFYLEQPPLQLDACRRCNSIWFDPQEYEAIPEGAIESVPEMNVRMAEAIGKYRIEQINERDSMDAAPDEAWKTIPALFGLPVENNAAPLSCVPWATWILSGVIAVVSILAFFNLESVISDFGFVPAEAFRYGGLTFLTSFFLHGGILHLVGNLYFLWVFGDNVEDYLGWRRYLLLIFASTIAGDCVHLLLQAHSTMPSVGASGGISGIIVFYALQFPRARLGFMFGIYFQFRWLQIPAWGALVLWLLMQSYGLLMQLSGLSHVASTAHIGGSAAGFLLWWIWRKAEQQPAT
jgi:membrane associated rhomboid family serine protease